MFLSLFLVLAVLAVSLVECGNFNLPIVTRGGSLGQNILFLNATNGQNPISSCMTLYTGLDSGTFLYQTEFDDSTSTYICSIVIPPQLFVYYFRNNTLVKYLVQENTTNIVIDTIVSFTTYKGTAYILVNANYEANVLTLLDVVQLSSLTRITINDISNLTQKISFNVGTPMLFVNGLLYTEVDNLTTRLSGMIQIDYRNKKAPWIPVGWLGGWLSLYYSPSCKDIVYGLQHGILYAINLTSEEVTTIVHRRCITSPAQQALIQMSVDFSREKIVVLDVCQVETPQFVIYDFGGNLLNVQSITASTCIPFALNSGFQILATPSVVGNCPKLTINSTVNNSEFSIIDLYITVGVAAGVILLIILAFGFYIRKLKKTRTGYQEIRNGDRNANASFQDVLSASGGQIDANEIEIKDLIGQGSFANVYRGKIHETEVAVKVIKFVSMKDMEKSLLEEASLMVKLRHPHIVLFMGACVKTPDLFIVTEYMENGSVRELLDKKEVLIENEHIKKFAIDACKGMAYLHSRKILHRDLKTHNLLVDGNWNVKVADFGLSRSVVEDGTMTACGTPSWAAPEVLRRDHYSYKADIYSFGICLWEMTTRQRPYGSLKPYQVVIHVATNGLRPDIETSVIPPYFEKLMKDCWNDIADDRPDFTLLRDLLEALNCPLAKHPFPQYRKVLEVKSMPTTVMDRVESQSSKEMNTRNKLI